MSMLGATLLCYQKFHGSFEPSPPFECVVVGVKGMYYSISYRLEDGTRAERNVNTACCSSQPIHAPRKRLPPKKRSTNE